MFRTRFSNRIRIVGKHFQFNDLKIEIISMKHTRVEAFIASAYSSLMLDQIGGIQRNRENTQYFQYETLIYARQRD